MDFLFGCGFYVYSLTATDLLTVVFS